MNAHYEKLFLLFSDWLKKQDYSTNTQKVYTKTIESFLMCVDSFGVNGLKNVSEELLRKFITTRGGKPYAQANINLRQSALGLFYGWAHANRYCLTNMMLEYKKTKINQTVFPKKPIIQAKPVVLTPEEQLRLINMPGDDFITLRDKCMINTILISGLYAKEMVKLLIDDIDLEGGYIKYTNRQIPIDLELCEDMYREYLLARPITGPDPDAALLFVNKKAQPLNKQVLYRVVSKAMTAAGINKKQQGADILRQTAICNMFAAGKTMEEVRAITGISTLKNLQKYCEC